jgi:hypothetical protein
VKTDVVQSLNLQLEQMQLAPPPPYPEDQEWMKSMSDVQNLVESLPDISETVRKTHGLVQGLDQSRLGMWNKIRVETISMLTIHLQMKSV